MLGDRTLVGWASKAAREAGITERWVSSDIPFDDFGDGFVKHIFRPAALAQDDTPMIDVVTHALAQIPGEPDDIIVLLQPTQPFRKPAHITEAIRLLRETQADSVVSVVELPKTHSPEFQCVIDSGAIISRWRGMLKPYPVYEGYDETRFRMEEQPKCRQAVDATYIRDGTVYAFRRRTVLKSGNIYGEQVKPLIIDPADSCSLDTEADWNEVVRRWASAAVSHPA